MEKVAKELSLKLKSKLEARGYGNVFDDSLNQIMLENIIALAYIEGLNHALNELK